MTPHGPDTATFEASVADSCTDSPHHLPRDTLAFMFEVHATPRVTNAALQASNVDHDYYKCWEGLKSHFDEKYPLEGKSRLLLWNDVEESGTNLSTEQLQAPGAVSVDGREIIY